LDELLQYSELPIIVTSKDAVKIRALLINMSNRQPLNDEYQELVNRLWVLPVTAVLSDGCYVSLQQQLKALNINLSKSTKA
ncbi:MAG: tetraacyldisaccharide 4'-kinase, partial [Psychrobacter sp.]|nr:tetraacyldisaccharide 4'-kinase [Psychrobacter sp.]